MSPATKGEAMPGGNLYHMFSICSKNGRGVIAFCGAMLSPYPDQEIRAIISLYIASASATLGYSLGLAFGTYRCHQMNKQTQRRTNKVGLVTIFLILALYLSCNEDNSTSTKNSEYAGDWTLSLSGNYIASGLIAIKPDGQFSNDIMMDQNAGTMTVAGKVSDDGVVEGHLMIEGSQIGSMKGGLDHSGGSGTWQANDGKSGTWTIYPVFYSGRGIVSGVCG